MSTFTTTSSTSSTFMTTMSTEIPSTSSKTPSTTATSTFTTTSTTTTPMPSTSTEIPSTTSTTPGTTPSSTVTYSTAITPTSTAPFTTTTTQCFCVYQGRQYKRGETILDINHLGSRMCPIMICSKTCVIENSTKPCLPPEYDCPNWNKTTNETFSICNCTMAKCIKGNIIEIVPLQCPPLQNITCENYQPAVLVHDKHQCCRQYACDCFCQGWNSHYITFDGLYYTYQGNCTYVLVEEISPLFNLTIYIDSVYCDSGERASCARSIIVSYNQQDIILRNHRFMGGANLEALKGNVTLTLPFVDNDVRVINSSLNLFLEIPQLKVNVIFGITGFTINLPFQHFGNNTQGHCGTCNNNQADDCMIPGGTLINDCAVMADYWPASVVNNKICSPPAALPTVGGDVKTTPRPCQAHPDCSLLESKLFEACHSHVSPKNFFLACQLDSCNMSNPAVVCASLQSYASACSQVGVCIHWRNYTNNCNIKCPGDKIFLPCGPVEPPTCRDSPTQNAIAVSTEGCFCRQNTKLFNKESGVCVPQHCGCMDPSGKPREFDEHFEYSCKDCVCDKASTSVICKPKKCPDVEPENCTKPGFMLVNVTDPSDPCCIKQVCRSMNCDVSLCPPLNKKCAVGYSPVLEVPDGSVCPKIRCEPKSVCVYNNTEYEPGAKIPEEPCVECYCKMDIDPQTKLYIVNCSSKVCPDDPCFEGFKYVEQEGECCGTCKQISCIYHAEDNTTHILKDGDVSKYICETVSCHEINGSFMIEKTQTECPYLSTHVCKPGFEYVKKNGECCGTCRQVACIYNGPDNSGHVLKDGEVHMYTCETVSCHEINGSFVIEKTKTKCQQSSSVDCGPGFEYVKKNGECCGTCTQVACIYDAPNNTRHVLKDGKEYNFKCMNVTCLNRNGVFMTMESYKQCPYFNSDGCVPGTERLDKDGCCKICETNNCVLEKNVTSLHVSDCTSIGDVEVTSCTGHCDAKSMYLMDNNLMKHSCSCCWKEKFHNRQVKLKCANDTEIIHDYVYIESCRCTSTMCENWKTSG